jgi:D-xylose 1-dehydrogenase (NADP+, D-xylono-1,5-lactone-forming)
MANQRKLNWGLLSTARINAALITPLRESKRNQLLAVASRTKETAEAYARERRIPRAHGSYAALLADPEIDIVYNSLPNDLHAEWTVRAVQAGKHVLCEKPLALTLAEVDAIAEAAQKYDRVVAEAFMYRSHPQTRNVMDIVANGTLGQIRAMRGSFTFELTRDNNYRFEPAQGGGALWDVGCYPVSFMRMVAGADPLEVFGWQSTGPTGIDETFTGQLRFPGEVHGQFDCSFVLPSHTFMEIVGTEATLIIPLPFKPGEATKIFISRGGKTETVRIKGQFLYTGEVEDMADAVLLGKPPRMSLADSRGNAATILALFESARTGKACPVEPVAEKLHP